VQPTGPAGEVKRRQRCFHGPILSAARGPVEPAAAPRPLRPPPRPLRLPPRPSPPASGRPRPTGTTGPTGPAGPTGATGTTAEIRSRDNCLIGAGYKQCYCLVIIVTSAPLNRPPVFSPKSRAFVRPFWHCGAPAVLVRGGPHGAPGQVQRVGDAAPVTARARTRQAGTASSRRLLPGGAWPEGKDCLVATPDGESQR
jgi:hypothetical protein